MDESLRIPLLFLVIASLFIWRVALSISLAMFLGWLVSTAMSVNTGWLTYILLLVGLIGGIVWHRRRPKKQLVNQVVEPITTSPLGIGVVWFFFGAVLGALLSWAFRSPLISLISCSAAALVVALLRGTHPLFSERSRRFALAGGLFLGAMCGSFGIQGLLTGNF